MSQPSSCQVHSLTWGCEITGVEVEAVAMAAAIMGGDQAPAQRHQTEEANSVAINQMTVMLGQKLCTWKRVERPYLAKQDESVQQKQVPNTQYQGLVQYKEEPQG